MSSCPSPALQSLCLSLLDFTVVDLELSTKALEAHLLKHTLRVDHPEYAVRHRALLVDRTFYNDQIEDSKVCVAACESSPVVYLITWLFCCRRE